ncbi:hypothetical protein [Deinococcus sedimenti]|uniref:Uncharacterized protein n=1 Tax=Deinococcus sedimenti TaxID=1867090 RepID=A0ABQ2SBR3_9DEIO|nr:hypothetical protein [Deinococcus sedimenti]GGS10773.1 hypothetical protein GCM10008960_41000 [Deinococcus sedimenti]
MKDISKPRNITRIFSVAIYGSYGEGPSASVYLGHRCVLLHADAAGTLHAEIDGQAVHPLDAGRLLDLGKRDGHVELVAEEIHPDPTTIGNTRASKLHRLMARAGIPGSQHYGFASAALDRNVTSLAALTEQEARQVWAFLCETHPAIVAA